jgi:hypothetical protein
MTRISPVRNADAPPATAYEDANMWARKMQMLIANRTHNHHGGAMRKPRQPQRYAPHPTTDVDVPTQLAGNANTLAA